MSQARPALAALLALGLSGCHDATDPEIQRVIGRIDPGNSQKAVIVAPDGRRNQTAGPGPATGPGVLFGEAWPRARRGEPGDKGRGEKGAWFKDSEGDLIGIGQPAR